MRVRIERRGALTGPQMAEVDRDALPPDAAAALDAVLATPIADASPARGGDQPWYRVTVTAPGAPPVLRDVPELAAPLRAILKAEGTGGGLPPPPRAP